MRNRERSGAEAAEDAEKNRISKSEIRNKFK
jgi:hypothetical protein